MVGAGVVFAIDDATVRIARVEGAGFQANDVAADLQITAAGLALRATLKEVLVGGSEQKLRNVQVECGAFELTDERLACAQALVTADLPMLGRQRLRAALDYGRADGSLRVDVQGVRIGAGHVNVRLALAGKRWNAKADLQNVALQPLVEMARAFDSTLPAITASGAASLAVEAAGESAAAFTVSQLTLRGELKELTYNNESGSLATDKLQLGVAAELLRRREDWRFETRFSSTAGQAYFEPVFLDFGVHAMAAAVKGTWRHSGALSLEQFHIDHSEVLQAAGAGELMLAADQPVRELQLELQRLQFPGAYASYLQPYLVNTAFKSLTSSGALRGTLAVSEGLPQALDLQFDSLSFDDGTQTFALRKLTGELHWRSEEDLSPQTHPSQLRFDSGVLLGLILGESDFRFAASGHNVRLLQTARVPVFDGAIELESFRVRNLATRQVAFLVDATIQPISVAQLCRAFGWPEFGGQIGGVISKLRMREGVVTLGTTLEAKVFDGSVRLSDLRLEDALGQWPRFFANIGLENLDLNLVTQAFSFGRITGRLSGAIRDLRLFNWTPVAFDASLYTPQGDRSRHRISQRAVANIGNLGGGGASVTAALSSGFLKFFEEFNYDRLGLSCRLQNEVCYMNGVAPAQDDAYYLVKGKGLPRIDVIASARRVDWPRLVAQLKAATQSSGPSVR